MQIDLNHFKELFLVESAEHLAEMEAALLSLRSAPEDAELMNGIFRAAHSIKGGAGTFALNEVVRFTHTLESLLDRLRAGEVFATPELIDLLLQAKDVLAGLLGEAAPENTEAVLDALKRALVASGGDQVSQSSTEQIKPSATAPEPAGQEIQDFQVYFRPSPDILTTGCNPLLLLRNLADLGEVLETALHTEELPPIEKLDPVKCYLGWSVKLRTESREPDIREVFEFVEGDAEIQIEQLKKDQSAVAGPPVLDTKPASVIAEKKSPESAKANSAPKAQARESASVRVPTEKLDKLINLVGEMVIANTMVVQIVENFSTQQDLARLRESADALGRYTREIHERIMAVRMLPVGGLFARFQRLIHDLGAKTGKQIQLHTSGEETEVDKSMLEQLSDPLTHLIRNSCDHGLETAEERRALGKPEVGTVSLRAFHQAGNVVLEVSDDGRGLNLERIRQKAVDKGLIAANAELSPEQIQMLIFEPGFSTRDEVSDLSGRGVGMDVVKQNIKALSGSIALTSEPGKGTCIRLQLPLTLAILDGLVVRVGAQAFVLPLLGIVETIPLTPQSVRSIPGHGEVALVHGEPVPILHLDRLFNIPRQSENDSRRLGVVVEQGTTRKILVVHELLGQQQVVVKSLEQNFRKIDGAMGATILGDGKAAVILDISALLQMNLNALYSDREELVA